MATLKNNTVLLIDAGNTRIHWGIESRGLRILKPIKTHHEFSLPSRIIKKVSRIILCSVVPQKTREIKNFFRKRGRKVYIVGEDLVIPMKINYRGRLGQDRLLCAFTALDYLQPPLAVIDLGTAVTIDMVSKNREYLGGLIFPGMELSLDNLLKRAALLKNIKIGRLKKPSRIIGRTTEEAILSGLFYGYFYLCKGLIERMKEKNTSLKVILTGGWASLIGKDWGFVDIIEPNLSLIGLAKLAKTLEGEESN